MQTDFGMESIPKHLQDIDPSEGSVYQEVADFQRVVTEFEASAFSFKVHAIHCLDTDETKFFFWN